MTTDTLLATPTYEQDFWSDEVVLNPYPTYRTLRDLGPAVWLSRHEAWAITRHAEVRAALANPEVFSSARGCMMNDPMNTAFVGNILCTDDPEHQQMRKTFARPLMPAAVGVLKARMEELASEQVDRLMEQESFDAVVDIGHHLPINVVSELVGLPEDGRRHMLDWAAGSFDAFGPLSSPRTITGLEVAQEAARYTRGIDPARLAPKSWGTALFQAAERGDIAEAQARSMMMGYVAPALDTTINATSSAIWLFARNPDQWARLRADRDLMPGAINEVIRMESPIRAFSRYVTRDHEVGGVVLRQGARALMLYACANRDERNYPDPDRFDITRRARDHIGFGYGTHTCAGMHLAKLEMTVILNALADRVAAFEIVEEERRPHNTLRGLHRLIVRATPD
ncbi:cytochrome P450 [Albibacillus kandeliae]|uniref:cytochrome P450 n=1 Tax=Albibacillus kandeliae TaxID=2174228 RepID=UPI000D69C242|nr:cytochrome P450 [Albibacillus kandeliae]